MYANAASRMFSKSAVTGLAALLLSVPAARAAQAVIYSNVSSAYPGKSVSTQFLINNGFAGTPFVTTGSGNLDSIETALSQNTGSAPLTASLYTDQYNQPQTLLESWGLPVIPTCCGNVPSAVPPITKLVSVAHPFLTAGTKYWFILTLGAQNAVYWWYSDTGTLGGLWAHNTVNKLYPENAALPMPGIQVNSVASQPPARTGVLSHIAAGAGWSTVITLVNTSAAGNTITLNFHANDGSALSLPMTLTQDALSQTVTTATVNAALNPSTTLQISMGDQITDTAVGWVDVLATAPLGGFAIFRWTPATGSPQEGTVPLQTGFPATITLPYDNTNGFATGVALANLAKSASEVTATVFDNSGNLLGSQNIDMVANAHTSFSLPATLQQSAGKTGIVVFQSSASGGIAGLGLRFSPFGTFTSVPII